MTILVTGGSGFIGGVLTNDLARSGHRMISVSRRNQEAVLEGVTYWTRAAFLSQPLKLQIDAVIHLEVKQHAQNPSLQCMREFQSVNVGGTKEWLDWAEGNGIKKFIFFSSIKAAGDSAKCQDETFDSFPNTPYGESKLAAERLVVTWAAAAPDRTGVIVRPAVVYGPGNQANILSLIDAISRGRFFLVGKNDNIKSMISLRNLVAAVSHLMTLPLSGTKLFYLTDKESYSVSQIAGMIAKIMHKKEPRLLPLTVARVAASFGDAFVKLTKRNCPLTSSRLDALLENTHFSSAKLQNTGFIHPQTTREGLEEMIAWYLGGYAK